MNNYYIVKPGDDLYAIARQFNTTVDTIKNANRLSSNVIYPGQSLIIPTIPTLPYGTYGIGSQGPNIVLIQQALATLGFNVVPDGYYGPITSNLILNLQKKYPEALLADGVYGPNTRTYLQRLLSSGYRIVKDPTSPTVLVNKLNALSPYYVPKDLTVPNVPFPYAEFRPQKQLREVAARALEALFFRAKKDNINLNAISGYRSYDTQYQIFSRNIATNPNANITSSRPGESEHQTGFAIDVSSPSVGNALSENFGNTKEGKWLAQNAPDFGFIIRFPKGKESITGYAYEPWHIRYVGRELAKEISNRNITLEEYYRTR